MGRLGTPSSYWKDRRKGSGRPTVGYVKELSTFVVIQFVETNPELTKM